MREVLRDAAAALTISALVESAMVGLFVGTIIVVFA